MTAGGALLRLDRTTENHVDGEPLEPIKFPALHGLLPRWLG